MLLVEHPLCGNTVFHLGFSRVLLESLPMLLPQQGKMSRPRRLSYLAREIYSYPLQVVYIFLGGILFEQSILVHETSLQSEYNRYIYIYQ